MNKVVFGIIAVVVIALVGGVFLASDSDDETASNSTTSTNQSTATQDSDLSSEGQADTIEVPPAGSQGVLDYSAEALAASETEDNLLFFHAKWCTVCNSVERNIEAGSIPDTLSIFKVDYDSDIGQALAEQYNIPIQYSMVQVDPAGTEIGQWVNTFGDGIDDITENLL